ncbi:MAG TPA: o-succinylbenzoate--CoA ligase [Mycobacterium sp.]|nr:o-succinylbenzoate--CoA ligase [Mycobacterium sp.]
MLAALDAVLDGRSSPLLPVPAGDLRQSDALTTALRVGEEIGDDVALVVPTSGTTGTPKGAMLSAPALIASATATYDHLGGPGTWLLALPSYHIAGIQVLVRSALAGTVPAELDVSAGFDTAALPAAVASMGSGRRYGSLVPAQLAKALADAPAATALAELDAVLLGGGPAPVAILEGAAAAGISVVRTYGMSETSGGCIYDGRPLNGVQVRIDEADRNRVVLGGTTLANGYRNPPTPDPFAEPGWFRTDDIGALDDSGVLHILGRVDDAISTGGLTVLPQPVEAVLARHPAIADCAVFGVPDDRLGQRVVAAVVVRAGAAMPSLADLRAHVAESLAVTAAPREVHAVDELPRLGIGKLDRRALIARFS